MNTARSIIKELGGPTKVAAALKVRVNVVGNWTARGIPWHWHDELLSLARNRGVDLTRDQLKRLARSPKVTPPHKPSKRRAA